MKKYVAAALVPVLLLMLVLIAHAPVVAVMFGILIFIGSLLARGGTIANGKDSGL